MHFTFGIITFTSILTSLSVVSAAPAIEVRANATTAVSDVANADGHIYICTDDNWSGSCENFGFIAYSCSNFPSNFQDDISSVGPDSGWYCTLYIDYNCNPDQGTYTVTAPGYSALTYGNDAFSSVMCDPLE
ncbi:hypothetical protein PHLCEN_2v9621 [Hermanssonia centrifuga]|uniref:Uncharacterized protein n=1 Tax=Hermanssonia centrifuga TaxID=98765 RepID=A0A2R6NQC9_9APHY|nr:hypothetical protein PHLCEN_2v9621 [Hermanssonia centrifuga]